MPNIDRRSTQCKEIRAVDIAVLTEQVIIWAALVTPAISVKHLSAQIVAVSVWVET